MMFDNFQAYDVQETRRVSREEGRLEGRIEGERAGRIEGERTGRIEGEQLHLIKLVIKKIEKQCSAAQISEILEEPLDIIQQIYNIQNIILIHQSFLPDARHYVYAHTALNSNILSLKNR